MSQAMCPHVRYAVEMAMYDLDRVEGPLFSEMIEAIGQEIVFIRMGHDNFMPNDMNDAVDRASREVLEAFNVIQAYLEKI
ncbi:hypothetical protein [Mesorhizobium sp. A623]